MTAQAEVPALAGERQQVLVRTVVTADAREAVPEDPAREELVGDLRHDGAPRAVCGGERSSYTLQRAELIRDEAKEHGRSRLCFQADAID